MEITVSSLGINQKHMIGGLTKERYYEISKNRNLPNKCPYADNYTCSRYLLSNKEFGIVKNIEHPLQIIEDEWAHKNDKLNKLPRPYHEDGTFTTIKGDPVTRVALRTNLCPESNSLHGWEISYKYQYIRSQTPEPSSSEVVTEHYTSIHFHQCDIYRLLEESKNVTSTTLTEDHDIDQDILLNYWTVNDGNVLKISAIQNGHKLGEVYFELSAGAMSKQRSLIQLLIEEREVTVHQIFDCCYAEDKKQLKNNTQDAQKLIGRVRSLVSDIRKKLDKAGINKEILTPLAQNIDVKSTVALNVAAINPLDDKHEKNEYIPSYMPPDELSASEKTDDEIDNLKSYNPDKFIDGFDDDD